MDSLTVAPQEEDHSLAMAPQEEGECLAVDSLTVQAVLSPTCLQKYRGGSGSAPELP